MQDNICNCAVFTEAQRTLVELAKRVKSGQSLLDEERDALIVMRVMLTGILNSSREIGSSRS